MEQDKVQSLRAKNEVEIIVDNPKILPEPMAKSLPPVPFPQSAPESPKTVEGWKGVKVGGWRCMGKVDAPPLSVDGDDDNNNWSSNDSKVPEVGKLSLEDDESEMTEDSTITSELPSPALIDSTAPVENRKKLFPQNSKRNLRQPSGGSKRTLGKKTGSLKGIVRPSLRNKNSSKSKQISELSPSPPQSGTEDN